MAEESLPEDDGFGVANPGSGFRGNSLAAPSRRRWELLLAGVLVVGLTALRVIHLSADTPLEGEKGTFAVHVDEGYKTVAARNLALFGVERWAPEDEYPGWRRGSPLTHWFHLLTFSIRYPDLIAVRVMAVVASFLLSLIVAVVAFRRYRLSIAASCLLFIGVSSPLYFYTRISMFEPLLAVCVYCALAVAGSGGGGQYARTLVGAAALSVIATYGVKKSAVLYFAPICGALLAGFASTQWRKRPRVVLGLAGVMALGAAAFLLSFPAVWISRIGVKPGEYVRDVLFSPLSTDVAFLMVATSLATLHIVMVEGRHLWNDGFRITLLSLIVVAPAVIAGFSYNPPRYYVPIMPALVLLVAEWFAWQGWRRPLPSRAGVLGSVFAVSALVIAILAGLQGFNLALLQRLPLPLGDEPGLGERFLFVFGGVAAVVIGVGLWVWRRQLLRPRWIAGGIIVSSLLHLVGSLESEVRFWLEPKHEAVELARTLEESLPADARIAGDWAPMAVIGTGFRALYVAPAANPPSKLLEIQPDYFLSSGNERDLYTLREARELGIEISDPVVRTQYAGHQIEVLPLRYPRF